MKLLFVILLVLCAQILPLTAYTQEESSIQNQLLSEANTEPLSNEIASANLLETSNDLNGNELAVEAEKEKQSSFFSLRMGIGYGFISGKYSGNAFNASLRYEDLNKGLEVSFLDIFHTWKASQQTAAITPFFKFLLSDMVRVLAGVGPAISKSKFRFSSLNPTEKHYSLNASVSMEFTYLLKNEYIKGIGLAANVIQPVYFLNQASINDYKTYYPTSTYSLLIDF